MIAVRLRSGGGPLEPRLYRLADEDLASDVPVPELAPFAVAAPPSELPPALLPELSGRTVFDGEAALGGRTRHVTCRLGPTAYHLAVDGAGRFAIAPDGRSIVHDGAGDDPPAVVEAMLGPALCLTLALRGTFCLHASAVVVDGRAVAFLGASGAGKSTLAALLDAQVPGFRRLADDLLPVALAAPAGPEALPRFPQRKLGAAAQPALGAPERLPLAALCLLEGPRPAVELAPLAGRDAALALLRHTVAARLFGPELLARHLELCAAAAARLPVRRLGYPWRPEAARQVGEALAAELTPPATSARS